MKKLLIFATVAISVFGGFVAITCARDISYVPTGWVNDYSQVLTDTQVQQLNTTIGAFEAATTHEITVAIVPTIGDEVIDDFAAELFQKWEVGKKGKDDGVLIVIVTDDRLVHIDVGTGIALLVSDEWTADLIQRTLVPALKLGNYYEGIRKAVDKLILRMSPIPTVEAAAPAVKGHPVTKPHSPYFNPLSIQFFAIFLALFVLLMFSVLGHTQSWWLGGVIGGIIGIAIGYLMASWQIGLLATFVLVLVGLFFDWAISRAQFSGKNSSTPPWHNE